MYSGDPKTGFWMVNLSWVFEWSGFRMALSSLERFTCKNVFYLFIKQSRLIYRPFKIQISKTSGFRMIPVFKWSVFGSPLYQILYDVRWLNGSNFEWQRCLVFKCHLNTGSLKYSKFTKGTWTLNVIIIQMVECVRCIVLTIWKPYNSKWQPKLG